MDIYTIFMVFSLLLVASITDLRSNRIPNLLTFSTMLAGLVYHSVINGLDGLMLSAQGLILGIALLILPYLAGGMGAGDAKLMGAVGGLLGPKDVFHSFLFSAIVGGFYALAVILINRQNFKGIVGETLESIRSTMLNMKLTLGPDLQKNAKPRLCYGLAIALGTSFYILAKIFGYYPY
jgi:prepilin peptidase CpaA